MKEFFLGLFKSKFTEKLSEFIDLLFQVIPVPWLVAIGVLFTSSYPDFLIRAINFTHIQLQLPTYYNAVWFISFYGFIFGLVVATLLKSHTLQYKNKESEWLENPPELNRLFPFKQNDAEIFGQLHRNEIIDECFNSIEHDNYRLYCLGGPINSGKTSFLKAGLIPKILQATVANGEPKYACVYVNFGKENPLNTIRKSAKNELELTESEQNEIDNTDALQLLNAVEQIGTKEQKTIILILDQFEQLFIHHHQEVRQQLALILKEWYQSHKQPDLKILFSIQREFHELLKEFEREVGYDLQPRQQISLNYFGMNEAQDILGKLFYSARLKFSESFQLKILQEIAFHEDKKISPHDLQFVTSALVKNYKHDYAIFDSKAYKQIKGFEGILGNYLLDVLQNTSNIEERKRSRLYFLLSLMNPSDARNELSLEELYNKYPEPIELDELLDIIAFFTPTTGVKLMITKPLPVSITSHELTDEMGYMLAYKETIPAIQKLEGESWDIFMANELLNKRLEEWDKNHDVVLTAKQLKKIATFEPHKKLHKSEHQTESIERLITISQKVIRRKRLKLALYPIAFFLFSFVFFSLWNSSYFQITQVRRDLKVLSTEITDREALAEIAEAFAKDQNSDQALMIVEKIKHNGKKVSTLINIANIFFIHEKVRLGAEMLDRALPIARNIQVFEEKIYALIGISETFAEIEKNTEARQILEEALKLTSNIKNLGSKASLLPQIASIFERLNVRDKAIDILRQEIQRLETPYDLKRPYNTEVITVQLKIRLAILLNKAGKLNEASNILDEAFDKTQEIMNAPKNRDNYLCEIAIAFTIIGNQDRAETVVEQIDSFKTKSEAIERISQGTGDSQVLGNYIEEEFGTSLMVTKMLNRKNLT